VKNTNLKHQIHVALVKELTEKVSSYARMLESIRQSKNGDTKSSAGDKFETSREMMQMEIDKTEMQLNKVNYELEILNQLNTDEGNETATLGNLVVCNTGYYYLSIGHGSVVVNGKKYYAISLASPIGQILVNKKIGDTIEFNNRSIKIEEIL
jgi:hypothetical protein